MIYEVYAFEKNQIIEIYETKSISETMNLLDAYTDPNTGICNACWRINTSRNEPYETIRKEDE